MPGRCTGRIFVQVPGRFPYLYIHSVEPVDATDVILLLVKPAKLESVHEHLENIY